ncbi:MAG: DAK2 domain-containing protein [Actinobacteria bacterium]|nr:MAG: DAK2 domain-containing protein [Actinomycetota bacterium]
MVEKLDASDLVGLVDVSIDALKLHKDEINAMNVFPVPDGDTGTNMLLTMQAVKESILNTNNRDIVSVCQAISRGSLMGARGNSGVVLSQILKGMTEVIGENESADVDVMAKALVRGSDVAYRAVMKPVEGTILTVVREASEEGARSKDGKLSLDEWFTGVVLKARETLEHTPDLLPVLREAGVVDAGGRGLLAIFEGILAYLTGEELQVIEEEVGTVAALAHVQVEDFRYEAQFILHCKDSKAERFRETLHEVGGSVLVVGGDKLYRVHVHTDQLGKVIEEASAIGRLSDVEITDLKLQVEELDAGRAVELKPTGVIAVAVGDGIKEILRSMGVDHVVDGGQSMNPSTAEMLDAINSIPQDHVLLIPNNKNIVPAAEQTRELTEKEVVVIPAVSIAEGFAAMVAFDPRGDLENNGAKMLQAMQGVKTGAVTVAVRDSKGKSGKIKKGNYIGLFRGEIVSASSEALEAAGSLLENMIEEDDEIVSMVIGDEGHGLNHAELIDLLEDKGMEVEVIDGGQPVYHYIFGVE